MVCVGRHCERLVLAQGHVPSAWQVPRSLGRGHSLSTGPDIAILCHACVSVESFRLRILLCQRFELVEVALGVVQGRLGPGMVPALRRGKLGESSGI